MGLDQADTCEYLRALLPELPQADAERLIRYYWRDDIDGTAATERIDDKIKHRITMAIYYWRPAEIASKGPARKANCGSKEKAITEFFQILYTEQ